MNRIVFLFFALFLGGCCNCPQQTTPPPPVTNENAPKPIEKVVVQRDTVTIVRKDTVVQYIEKKNNKTYSPNTPIEIEEFRGAWIATVANITWPSKPGLSAQKQQQEAIELLDFLEQHHYNAAILQVRPQADALYNSNLEPWSYFLTGEMGQEPQPFYDPLQFWIEQAHQRGIELHAWLNPFRAHHSTGQLNNQSVVHQRPQLAIKLANGMYWLDPALPQTKQLVIDVVDDILSRYDVDGIHFDDYFYPYDSYHNGQDFPDEASWQQYKQTGGQLTRANWRRNHVNELIQTVYKTIKEKKPYVKFGISPFGIWRPGHPRGVEGFDQYERLYADAKKWLNEGWVDYLSPQLYWKTGQVKQSFPLLLGWWHAENTHNRHLWPGLNISSNNGSNKEEITNQILITRGYNSTGIGSIHWSLGTVANDKPLAQTLKTTLYEEPALVPASPWLCQSLPNTPLVTYQANNDRINIQWKSTDTVHQWVLYYQYKGEPWNYDIFDKNQTQKTLPMQHQGNNLAQVGVTATNRAGCQSSFKQYSINH